MSEAQREPGWVPADTFANRLRLVRHELGLRVEEVAGRCEVPTATWSAWEHGASPRALADHVRRIAKATGVDPFWLMWGDAASTTAGGSVTLGQPAVLGAVALPDGQLELPLHALDMRDQLAVVDG